MNVLTVPLKKSTYTHILNLMTLKTNIDIDIDIDIDIYAVKPAWPLHLPTEW